MQKQKPKIQQIWKMFAQSHGNLDHDSIRNSIITHLEFTQCKTPETVDKHDLYYALAHTVKDRLLRFVNASQENYEISQAKQVNYLSLEYLIGRSLRNNLVNLGIYETCAAIFQEIGYELSEIEELEADAGLGNGGLGRLAACFMDSLATLQLPAYGYGIRYDYGIFKQHFENGQQIETPDSWLNRGYPWEIPRPDIIYPVRFYGSVIEVLDTYGRTQKVWKDTEKALAVAYDVPISGYQNQTVNILRLWSAKALQDFDFESFNSGGYMEAVDAKQRIETISKVLYPNDQEFTGKELRLKQQYFFVSASLQDMIVRYKKDHSTFASFAEKVAIQLNDTHPSIAIPELMRLFVDIEGLAWEEAWEICQKVFAYTNHTVLPEALERWPVEMMSNLLPRHLEIIYEINQNFLQAVETCHPGNLELLQRMSLVEEGWQKQIRMPFLSIIGSHTINGVAALHTDLLKKTIFQDFYKMFPERFQNKTNGITPRLWLRCANPELSALISEKIGTSWITKLEDLQQIAQFKNDPEFCQRWREVKRLKKQQFANWIEKTAGITLNLASLFDVQVKRIHEYKRQLLNILQIITLYNRLKEKPDITFLPRTFILAGKAAPGYYMAKLIIRLANDVARVVNNDPVIGNQLKVVFVENYRVSVAEKIIPATDISEHISTAGTEASGTSNMKFCLNGALIIGTMDGANIEIYEEVGADNIFTFGLLTPQVAKTKAQGYNPRIHFQANRELREALSMINTGYFNRDDPQLYNDIHNSLIYDDQYMLCADFAAYTLCQQRVGEAYLDQERWTSMSIMNTAHTGKFSSDRTIQEYAEQIWQIKPVTSAKKYGTKNDS